MARHDHPGLFVSFEGLGGSGVSHQSKQLAIALEKDGYRVLQTQEPTNYLIGGLIRSGVVEEWRTSPDALQLLFAADRAHHIVRDIEPALEAGRIVISNRYALSGIAYGTIAVGDEEWLRQVNRRFLEPDITFLLRVSPKNCARRLKERHFEIELYREEQKLASVWEVYERLSKESEAVRVIDGERDDLEILTEVKRLTLEALEETGREHRAA